MYVLNGFPTKSGAVGFGLPGRPLAFACASDSENLGQLPAEVLEVEWNALGAIGKCTLWPDAGVGVNGKFEPKGASNHRFNACVRAVRADYCGDGVTYTKDRTPIYLYDAPRPIPAGDLILDGGTGDGGFFFEANWDDNGAICIVHARYLSLPPDCKLKYDHAQKFDAGLGYHCKDAPDGGFADFQSGILIDYSNFND
jgi:hypothetical protein